MFYSYRKFKKTSNKCNYLLCLMGLIIIIWFIIACVGLDVESKIIIQDIEILDKL